MGSTAIDLSAGLSSPPPSSNAGGGIDLSAGLTTNTPPAATQTTPDLTNNPKNEGTYQMTASKDGTPIQVPYSQVPVAMQRGYGMDFNGDGQRYMKDRAADPNTSSLGDAIHAVLSLPGDVAHGLKLWLPNPKELAKGAIKHEAEVPQSVASWFGGEEAKTGIKNLENRLLAGSGNPASNASQQRGENMASVGEFAAGEKVLAKLTEAVVPLAEGTNYVEKLKNAQPIIKAAAAHPRIARVLAAGLSQGLLSGGQAALHGAGAGDAALDAAVGGGIGAGFTGVPEGLANLMETRGPIAETIAGETVPTLSSQQPGTGPRGDVKINEVPQMAAAQQAAAPRVFQNIAQRATQEALEEANAGRRIPNQITDARRMLPAPADARPYAFTIPGTGTTEESVGDLLQPAAKAQRAAFKPPYFVTSSADIPNVPGVEGSYGNDIATGRTPQPGADFVSGGGDLVTASPETAQMHLSRLNSLIDDPPAGVTPEQMQAMEAARDHLQQQMDMYHTYQRTMPNFAPIDSARAAEGVTSFGDMEDQLQNAAGPMYKAFNDATDGEFNELMARRNAAGRRGDFAAKFAIEKQMDALLDSTPGVSAAERAQATRLWERSKIAGAFDDVIENAANVRERYASQVEGGRSLSGTKLQNGLQKLIDNYGTERLEAVVGREGMENMTRMADLLKEQPKGGFQQLSANVVHNLLHGKVGAGLGTALGAHLYGYEGATAGALMGAQAERFLLRAAATNPRVGQMIDYAVRNGVSPRIAAALVAQEITRVYQPDAAQGGTQ